MISILLVVMIAVLIGAGLWIWQERARARDLERIARELRRYRIAESLRAASERYRRRGDR